MKNPDVAKRVRLLLNVISYLKNHPGIKLSRLAAHFAMNDEDMRRLLLCDVLVTGVPPYTPSDYLMVFFDERPDGARVTLHQGDEFKRPLKLTAAEACALKTALEGYTRGAASETRAVADSLLTKIEAAMRGDKRTLAGKSLSVARRSEELRRRLELLDEAVALERVARIEYYSAAHGTMSRRRVRPLELFEEGARFYLRGWCERRQAIRSFRVDRMRKVEVLDEVALSPRTPQRPRASGAVPGWDGTKAKGMLVARFEPHLAEDVAATWSPRGGTVAYDKDGSLVLRLPLYSETWALGWVLSFGSGAELLEPAYLRDELVKRIRLMLAGKSGTKKAE